MLNWFLPLATGLFVPLAMGAVKTSVQEVNAVLSKLRSSGSFYAKVRKNVVQEVLGTESSGTGQFYFSKGRLRLEMAEPENTVLVYDGKTVWMENRLDSKTVAVTKVKSKVLKKNDSLLAALFDRKDVLSAFTLVRTRNDRDTKVFSFKPRDKKKTEIELLEIGLNGTELGRVSYKDDRENVVTFEFSELKRKDVAKEKFAYRPPPGAVVTEL